MSGTKKPFHKRTPFQVLLCILAAPVLWALLATYHFEFRVPRPSVDSGDSSLIYAELQFHLTRELFDSGCYDKEDGWFARRVEDLCSMGRVTDKELARAHELMSRMGKEFDTRIYYLARDSGSYGDGLDVINSYIEVLAEREPRRLQEFLAWMAAYVNGEDTGPMLMAKIQGKARSALITATEKLPLEAEKGKPSRRAVLAALGGGPVIGTQMARDYFEALVRCDAGAAAGIAKQAGRTYALAPKILPAYLGDIGRHDSQRIDKIVDTMGDYWGSEKIIAEMKHPKSAGAKVFVEFAKRELGMSAEEVPQHFKWLRQN